MRWDSGHLGGAGLWGRVALLGLLASLAAVAAITAAPEAARGSYASYSSSYAPTDGLSNDGRTAVYPVDRRYFTGDLDNVHGSINGNAHGLHLYRDGEVTDLITKAPPKPEVQESGGRLRAFSGDGSTVLFATEVRQVPTDHDNQCDLFEYRDERFEMLPGGCSPVLGISADGRTVYLVTDIQLLSSDTDQSADIYERHDGDLTLVTGAAASVDPESTYAANVTPGGALVFETPERLVAADTDDARDVYFWRDGHAELVSTSLPEGDGPAHLLDSSRDGSSIVYAPGEYAQTSEAALLVHRSGAADPETITPTAPGRVGLSFLSPDGAHLFYSLRGDLRDHTPSSDSLVDSYDDSFPSVRAVSDDGNRILVSRVIFADDWSYKDEFFLLDRTDDSYTPVTNANNSPALVSHSPSLDYMLFDLGFEDFQDNPHAPEAGPLSKFDHGAIETLYPDLGYDIGFDGLSSDGQTWLVETKAVLEPHDFLYPDFHTSDLYLKAPNGKFRILTQPRYALDTNLFVFEHTDRSDFNGFFDSTQQAARFDCRYYRTGTEPPPYENCLDNGYGILKMRGLEPGSYEVEGFVTNISGEVDETPIRRTVIVDPTPPTARFLKGPKSTVKPGTVRFRVRTSERRFQLQCRLDGKAWRTCTRRIRRVVRQQGPHVLKARIRRESKGVTYNWGPTSSYRFQVAHK